MGIRCRNSKRHKNVTDESPCRSHQKIILNPEWYNPPNPQARRRPRRLIERKTV